MIQTFSLPEIRKVPRHMWCGPMTSLAKLIYEDRSKTNSSQRWFPKDCHADFERYLNESNSNSRVVGRYELTLGSCLFGLESHPARASDGVPGTRYDDSVSSAYQSHKTRFIHLLT